jgi:lysophospholipase L1-like esterase
MASVQVDRRWLLAGLLIGGAGGTYAVVRAVTRRPKIVETTRLMLVGDSLAVGMNPHFKELATAENIPYVSLAKEGTRIDQWDQSAQLLLTLDQFQPTLVLVSLGTNDAFTAIDPDSQVEAMSDLIDKLESSGAEVVWIGAPALPDTYAGRHPNEEMLDAIRGEAPYYFASHKLQIPRGPDQLHPTSGGYGGWAGAVWEWLT